MKLLKAKSKWFDESDLRLDAEYHLSDGPATTRLLVKSEIKTIPLSKAASKVFSGKIFKRTFVNDHHTGIPYLTASDMIKSHAVSGKYLSKKFTSEKKELFLKKGWILLSCSGTLGNTVFTNKDFEGVIGTHDLIRIVPNENEIKPGYLYAYLASKFGYSLLTQPSYGGVIKHIEPHHIQNLPIPIFSDNQQLTVHQLVVECNELRSKANELLKRAEARLYTETKLKVLNKNDYEFFGQHSHDRKVSTYVISSKQLSSVSLNAFNYSERIRKLTKYIKEHVIVPL